MSVSALLDQPGIVRPAYFWVPERAGTFGYEAVEVASAAGLTLDPEQVLVLDAWMSHDEDGDWVASTVCLIEPRQNGKTKGCLIPIGLWELFCRGGKPDRTVWSAHRFKTSSDAFRDMKIIIDGNYEFRRKVKKISESHGEESIELLDGSLMDFLARSKSGGRGLGSRRPLLDEAFALQAGQLGALLPTVLARPDAQVVYTSSAGLVDSGPLREVRDRGRAGGDEGLVYIEWCAPGDWDDPGCEAGKACSHHRTVSGCALDNRGHWRKANHAMRLGRIRERAVLTMRRELTPREFGRECLGWWDEPDAKEVCPIEVAQFDLCADPKSRIHGGITIAIDVSRFGGTGAIAIAGRRKDDVHHMELVRYESGTEWIVEAVQKLMKSHRVFRIKRQGRRVPAVLLDPSSPAVTALPDLHKAKIFPILVTSREMGEACGGVADAVTAGPSALRHIGQPQVRMALEGAVRRDIGDGLWVFARRKSAESQVDIAPIVAPVVARWGLTVAEHDVEDFGNPWE